MKEQTPPLEELLTKALESAKMPSTELECQVTESVEMESDSVNVTVSFTHTGSQGTLNLQLLLKQLSHDTVLSSIDLNAPPEPHLLIQGSKGDRNYKIDIQLWLPSKDS